MPVLSKGIVEILAPSSKIFFSKFIEKSFFGVITKTLFFLSTKLLIKCPLKFIKFEELFETIAIRFDIY